MHLLATGNEQQQEFNWIIVNDGNNNHKIVYFVSLVCSVRCGMCIQYFPTTVVKWNLLIFFLFFWFLRHIIFLYYFPIFKIKFSFLSHFPIAYLWSRFGFDIQSFFAQKNLCSSSFLYFHWMWDFSGIDYQRLLENTCQFTFKVGQLKKYKFSCPRCLVLECIFSFLLFIIFLLLRISITATLRICRNLTGKSISCRTLKKFANAVSLELTNKLILWITIYLGTDFIIILKCWMSQKKCIAVIKERKHVTERGRITKNT